MRAVPDLNSKESVELSREEWVRIQVEMLRTLVRALENSDLRYYAIGGTLLGAVRHQGFIPWDDDVDIAMPRPDYERFLRIANDIFPPEYRLITYRENWKLPYNTAKVFDVRTLLIPETRTSRRVELGVHIDVFSLDGADTSPIVHRFKIRLVKALRLLLQLGVLDNSRPRPVIKRVIILLAQAFMRERTTRLIHSLIEYLITRNDYERSDLVGTYLGAYGTREFFPKSSLEPATIVSFEGLQLRGVGELHNYLQRIYGNYMQFPPEEERVAPHRWAYVGWRSDTEVDATLTWK